MNILRAFAYTIIVMTLTSAFIWGGLVWDGRLNLSSVPFRLKVLAVMGAGMVMTFLFYLGVGALILFVEWLMGGKSDESE